MEQNVFPEDVNARAKEILSTIRGSTGCYSDSVGIAIVRKHIAEYIEKRDGYPCNIKDIIVTNGASSAVKVCHTMILLLSYFSVLCCNIKFQNLTIQHNQVIFSNI